MALLSALLGSSIFAFISFVGVAGPAVVLSSSDASAVLTPLAILQAVFAGLCFLVFGASRLPNKLAGNVIYFLIGCVELVSGYFGIKALFVPLAVLSRVWVWLSLVAPALVAFLVISVVLAGIMIGLAPGFAALTPSADRLASFAKPGNRRHVLITGGGTGLGKALAIKFAAMGAGDITIMSRSLANLTEAKAEITKAMVRPTEQRCHVVPCDVTNYTALDAAVTGLFDGTKDLAAPHLVVTSAGMSHPGYFLQTDLRVYHNEMELNFFGTVNTCRVLLPRMIGRPVSEVDATLGRGKLCLVSSALGLLGSMGYSMYCPTKYAVRGLAESLHHELLAQKIDVCCFYPSNMDTESFKVENQTKPIEAKIIDESAATITPAQGADAALRGLRAGHFHFTTEFELDFLRVAVNGMMPSPAPIVEMFWYPAVHLAGWVMRWWFDRVVLVEHKKKMSGKGSRLPAVDQTAPLLGASGQAPHRD
ncbi:putative 3-ketodihydrosphingosine reductase [Paratrimastix pyriformis]|uniref:3-ketodihydrosphingosine reductase n=1 Tax=Paratrimastix pyriformis TaxID=342808 RepID=A0ABQ8UCV7_9EUKA|nr:putative 3-ketodihydrosphingosine reductase [Paratrimastix pyriformis]